MAHDVMISHSHEDKPAADAACAALEARGIRCWIAPRDINPGQDWATSILQAIQDARIMLLVFSRHANQSPQVNREVERAVHSGKTLLPLRIEDVLPEAALEYFLGTPHWLDAITKPFEAHLEKLADACTSLLAVTGRSPQDADQGSAASDPAPVVAASATEQPSAGGATEELLSQAASGDHFEQPPAPPGADEGVSAQPWWRQRRTPLAIAAGAVIVVAVTATVGYLLTERNPQPSTTTTGTTTTTTPTGPPPVAEGALDGLLLSPAEINTTMGATGMTVYRPWNTLNDVGFDNPSSPPECLPLGGAAEANVYAGSGWTAVRGQSLQEPPHYTHVVEQGVVLFPSAQAAAAFVSASTQSWPACANRSYHDNVNNNQRSVGPVTITNGTLSATTTQQGTDWACQRALTARNNVVIDATGCTHNNTTDQGVSIADQIGAKVPT